MHFYILPARLTYILIKNYNWLMKRILKWYKLDNAAKPYPMFITKNTQSLFRVSAILLEEIDGEKLQSALNDIIKRFPTFKVKLRMGLFWYYFEENTAPLKVFVDDGIVLKPINTRKTNNYFFRVSYFKKKISIDFFHAITDGVGATEFFKCLLHRYFELMGLKFELKNIIDINSEPLNEEIEDSFNTNYEKDFKLDKKSLKQFAGNAPLNIKGKLFKNEGYGVIFGTLSVAELKAKAAELNTSMTTLLIALLTKAIVATQKLSKKKKPVVIMVPVNLRKPFNSVTLRNFVLFARLEIEPDENKSLEEYIVECGEQLKAGVAKRSLQDRINTAERCARAPIFKYMPIVFKYVALKLGKMILKSRQTVILSNIGSIDLPENFPLDRYMININVTSASPLNVGVASWKDKLTVTFTRSIAETEVERSFFKSLADLGLSVSVASNYREEQYGL